MELSDEQKRRILAEEEARQLAEEEYRAQIRRELTRKGNPASSPRRKSSTLRKILLLGGSFVAVLIAANAFVAYRTSHVVSSPPVSVDSSQTTSSSGPPSRVKPCVPSTLTTAQIAKLAIPAVVVVENYNENGEKAGQGSGYVLSGDGVVITNYHVIRGASALTVKLPSRGDFRVDSLLGYDSEVDVAALQLPDSAIATVATTLTAASDPIDRAIQEGNAEGKRRVQEAFSRMRPVPEGGGSTGLPILDRIGGSESRGPDQPSEKSDAPCPIADLPAVPEGSLAALLTVGSPRVQVGDHVVAIGAPLGLENTVSEGIVSALRTNGAVQIIQTTASISPGSSGGPLLNDRGHVIGLTTSTVRNGQNLNFVISSKHIADLLAQKRQLSLVQMLTETRVEAPFPASTIPVPAGQVRTWQFAVPGQQGAVFAGTYTVTGGSGRDVAVMLMGPGNTPIVNSGRVSGFGQFSQRLPMGQYTIIFDNRFSAFSSKSVSPDLKLVYYR